MSALAGQVALVTGGGTGIGRATSLRLAGAGAAVVVASNVPEQAEAVAAEIRAAGGTAIAHVVDVVDLDATEAMRVAVEAAVGPVGILVTCAGIMGARVALTEIEPTEWRRTMAVNLDGTFYTIRTFLPGMLERDHGRIVTLSSASGKLPAALNADYAASKHGVIGLTKTIALELGMMGKKGVTANAICPGPIDTPMMDAIADHLGPTMQVDREGFRRAAAKNAQRRLLDPDEVAAAILYLAGPDARGITGQALNVCGGLVLF